MNNQPNPWLTPKVRDDKEAAASLQNWFEARFPHLENIEVGPIRRPSLTGGSSETLFVDVQHSSDGERANRTFVFKVEPVSFQVSLQRHIHHEFSVLETLFSHGVPVPRPIVYESDRSILGAEFYLIDFVPGRTPTHRPSYNERGWLKEASVADRSSLWNSAMKAMCKLTEIPAEAVAFLNQPEFGNDWIEQQLGYWRSAMNWACPGSPPMLFQKCLGWMEETAPRSSERPLSWGDARIGNMIFDNFECRAIVDWELVSLAGPLADLSWWLVFDDVHSSQQNLPRLEGLASRSQTLSTFEGLTGQSVERLEWYLIFSAFRLSVLFVRRLVLTPIDGQNLENNYAYEYLQQLAEENGI